MSCRRTRSFFPIAAIALALLALPAFPAIAAKPLKVYILVGQSNMEGQAKIETFDYIGDDPATAPLLKEMRGPGGKPRVCDRVWISYLTGSPDRGTLGEGFGKLTAGYGSRPNPAEDGGKIGPEFTFGITMEKAYDGPILLIKTAWGGKSLNTDFRPPSAGPYEFNEAQLEGLKKQGKDIEEVKAGKTKAAGRYYKLMIDHVKKVLTDPKRICPAYDPKAGYEIAGFVWFQGWNDMVDGGTYPYDKEKREKDYSLYSELMAHFIRDARQDLDAPKMPFVIGVMGVDGVKDKPDAFRQAMAAPASMDEFKGNVAAVETARYWDKPLAAIAEKLGKPRGLAYHLRKGSLPGNVAADRYPLAYAMQKEYWDADPKDRQMTKTQQQSYVKEYRAKLITPSDEALWKRGASNAGYHYLGCGKTMALIGKTFAEAMLEMEKK